MEALAVKLHKMLISHCLGIMALRSQSLVVDILGRADMLRDSAAHSKEEDVYLNDYEDVHEVRVRIGHFI